MSLKDAFTLIIAEHLARLQQSNNITADADADADAGSKGATG